MGFFSGIMNSLGGGSKGNLTESGGFNSLPFEIQQPYKNFGTEINKLIQGGNLGQYYKPTPLSTGEQSAIDRLFAGFAPTEQSISSDIAMQSNPYDKYVIDEINRQAQGDFSILKQAFDNAGQTGSNRSFIGAGDIDLRREGQIGQFKQNQYNTALNNALNTLPGMRQEDAAGSLAAGSYTRDLDMQNNAAAITALQELAKAMGILPTQNNVSTSGTPGTKGDPLTAIGNIASIGASFFSDENLKENIEPAGIENGFNIYKFNYKGSPTKFVGVMAQEILDSHPDAVSERDGYLCVDYSAIGVKFREASSI